MKLTTFILIVSLMQVSAAVLAQKITLQERGTSLKSVLLKLRDQTGYDFIYDSKVIGGKEVTINLRNASLEEALDAVFKSQNLDYSVKDKFVLVTIKVPSIIEQITTIFTNIDVSGFVFDENGNALPGAKVMIKGTTRMVVTKEGGFFRIASVDAKAILVITYVGYQTREIPAKPSLGIIKLSSSESKLDETRIIGYSTESRRFSVNSTSVITALDIEQQPVTNVLQALDGRIPGLTVNPSSGAPGATVRVQVRGQNTLFADLSNQGSNTYNQPLILVDGVPIAAQNVNISSLISFGGLNNLVSNSGISAINGLNPADIESLSVLKDADATAIYGSQGANGVIVITTKKGKPGKTRFSIGVNTQNNTITRSYQMLNTEQYLQMRRQAYANDKVTPTAGNAPDLVVYDQNKYTDWAHRFFNKSSANTDVHASLSGGSANSTFMVSAGYTKSTYNFPGNYADNRLTLHTGLHHSSIDQKFTVDFGADLSNDQNNSSSSPSVAKALLLPPNTPELVDPNGSLVFAYKGVDLTNYQMYAYLKTPANLQNFLINNTLSLGYEIIPGLKIALNSGYNRGSTKEYQAFPLASLAPGTVSTSASFAANTYQAIYIEPQVTYRRTIGKGVFNALAGGTYKKDFSYLTTQNGVGYSNDAFITSIGGALTVTASDASNTHKYADVFSRLGYVYDSKYIISLTGNRDASSNFGPGRQFANFGSAGLGWIFSEEKGFEKLFPFISYAKLAGNYGITGNEGGTPYMFNEFWGLTSTTNPAFQGTRTVTPLNLYNPDFSWSTQKALNLSIDMGFFKNRLLINAGWYVNKVHDQLIASILPSQTGFTSVFQNFDATVQNKGWEFTTSSRNIQSKSFGWSTTFQISANRNKLIAFPGLATSPYASTYELGQPVTEIYGYQYKSVNPTTGIFEFYAADGKTVVQYPNSGLASLGKGGDRVPIANTEPNFQGGLGNTFKYKSLSIMIYCQFSDQKQAPSYLYGIYAGVVPGTQQNFPTSLLGQFWENPGDDKPLQRLTSNKGGITSIPYTTAASYFSRSTGAYTRDFYVRVKTVALSYNLPDHWIKQVHMNGCKLYINAQNLLTFTNYKFLDPQTPGSYYGLPLQRTVSLGLSFDF